MGFQFKPTTKGRYVIQRRTGPTLPWVDIQGCEDLEAAGAILDWNKTHHGEWGPLGRFLPIEHRLVDTHDNV